ncbi:hypothetical protein GCM10023187_35630 [Nibrella viscosa]|uniref:Uncharacterized protein n=1 Tax=Nibrella viscosa TaxID=1084524 RepID=A0ABP8KNB5_9BACT
MTQANEAPAGSSQTQAGLNTASPSGAGGVSTSRVTVAEQGRQPGSATDLGKKNQQPGSTGGTINRSTQNKTGQGSARNSNGGQR